MGFALPVYIPHSLQMPPPEKFAAVWQNSFLDLVLNKKKT